MDLPQGPPSSAQEPSGDPPETPKDPKHPPGTSQGPPMGLQGLFLQPPRNSPFRNS